MKKLIVISLIFISCYSYPQIGIGTTAPHRSAQLDVTSSTKGFLPPRMDSNHRNTIVAPSPGLIIYNTSINSVEYFNGLEWIHNTHYVGETYGGGIIFFVYAKGQHGLIASLTDLYDRWYAGTYIQTKAFNGTNYFDGGYEVDGGKSNTSRIMTIQGVGDGGSYAALTCSNYKVTIDNITYHDWYLPSLEELNLMSKCNCNLGLIPLEYWSSNEYDPSLPDIANTFHVGNLFYKQRDKSNVFPVRPIRSF